MKRNKYENILMMLIIMVALLNGVAIGYVHAQEYTSCMETES